jgi:hypothetical protein
LIFKTYVEVQHSLYHLEPGISEPFVKQHPD